MRGKIFWLIMLSVLALAPLLAISGCQAGGGLPEQKTIVVDVAPGGVLDTMGRGIAPYFQKYIGATVIVENRAGTSGALARNYVWNHPPDGKLLIISHSSIPMYELMYGATADVYKKPYLQAFIPVAAWSNAGGMVVVTAKNSPIKTFADFTAASKQKKLTLAIGSIGSDEHVDAVILAKALGVQYDMVPFDSSGESLAAVLGGHVDAALADIAASAMSDKTFNMLGFGGAARYSEYPNLQTFAELGFPDLEFTFHVGAAVREGTPEDTINKLEAAFKQAFNDPAFQKWAKDTKKPLGEFYGRKQFTDYMTNWFKVNEAIYPSIKDELLKAAG